MNNKTNLIAIAIKKLIQRRGGGGGGLRVCTLYRDFLLQHSPNLKAAVSQTKLMLGYKHNLKPEVSTSS